MDLIKIGQFIADSRKNIGITQKELAEKIGVTDKAVSRWETGKGFPDVSVLKALAEALGVSITEIVNGEKSSPENIGEKSDSAVLETFAYIGKMTEKTIAVIILIAGIFSIMSPLFIAASSGSPWFFILGTAGIVLVVTALFFLLRKPRQKTQTKKRSLPKIAAEIISISALAVAFILELLPYGVIMRFMPAPDRTITRTYSFFSLMPLSYGNPFPMLTGVLTIAVIVLSAISLLKKSGGSPRNVTFICTVVALIFSLLPAIILQRGMSLTGIFVSVLLGISLFFQAYTNRRTERSPE